MIKHYWQKIVSAVSKYSANWMGSALSVFLAEIPKNWHSLLECMFLSEIGIRVTLNDDGNICEDICEDSGAE